MGPCHCTASLSPADDHCVGSHCTRWVVPLLCAFLRSALSRGALPPEPPGIYFPARMQGGVREVIGDTGTSAPSGRLLHGARKKRTALVARQVPVPVPPRLPGRAGTAGTAAKTRG